MTPSKFQTTPPKVREPKVEKHLCFKPRYLYRLTYIQNSYLLCGHICYANNRSHRHAGRFLRKVITRAAAWLQDVDRRCRTLTGKQKYQHFCPNCSWPCFHFQVGSDELRQSLNYSSRTNDLLLIYPFFWKGFFITISTSARPARSCEAKPLGLCKPASQACQIKGFCQWHFEGGYPKRERRKWIMQCSLWMLHRSGRCPHTPRVSSLRPCLDFI